MKSRSLLKLKKLILILILGLISNQLLAQNNIGIFFQAVARDNYSNPAKSRKIYIQSSVIQSSATGTKVLIEEHQANTDATGMFNISIGNGNRVGGSATGFSSIDWSNGPFFLNLKVAITPMSGVTGWDYTKEWVDMGTTSFGAVPYALYAANAAGVNQKLNISDTSNMLSVYAKAMALQNLATTINTKLSLSDSLTKYVTPTMLAANAFDSTSLSNRINLKANATDVNTSLATKVDKVTGKELSTNDYTTAEKSKLAAITGNNTGDQDLSALATNTALALKANTTDVNTVLALKANTTDVTTGLATKVDKVTGKELSTNDYTTAEKSKLAAITGTNTGDQDLSALATNVALALKANTADVNNSLATKENTSNKSVNITTDAASDIKYPSVKSVKTYVDAQVAGANIADADAITKGKIQLAGDLAGTAAAPSVPGLALKANTADVTTALNLKANIADVNTALATKVDKVTGKELSTNDYTTAEKSKLAAITGTNTGDQDLSALATNTALALKANTSDVNNSLATKENTSNKSVNITTDAASDAKYPSVKSVKTYVDAQVAGANIADADANTKGKIQLAGDIAGTAAAPTVPGLALKANISSLSTVATSGSYNDLSNKPTIPSAYTLPTASASVLGGVKVGSNLSVDGNGVLSANINAGSISGTVTVANGGTGATSLTGLVKGNGTNALTAAIAGTDYQAPLTLATTGTGAATFSGTTLTIPTYSLPIADGTNLGGVKVGSNLSVDGNGVLSANINAGSISGTVTVANGGTGATSLTGLVKGNGTNALTAAIAGTDYQAPLTLATTGTGAATFSGTTLTIPTYSLPIADGTNLGGVKVGSNLSVDGNGVLSANINAGSISGTVTVANGGTGATSLTGLVKGNGTNALTAAIAGTDYQAPLTLATTGTGAATFSGTTLTIPTYSLPIADGTNLGGVKVGSNLSVDGNGVLSANINAGSISGTVTVANGGTGATSLTGLVKGNGTNALTAAIAGTDYQAPLTLATTGTGAATFSGTTLTIPTYSLPIADGTNLGGVKVGSNLSVDGNGVLSANINAGSISGTVTVANGGTGATSLTGLVKGNGTNALTAAIAGTDYQAPLTLATTGTGAATFSGTTLTIPTYSLPIADGTNLGGVKVGSNLSVDGNGVLSANINAGTLTGTTLAANVVNSSLTSVGTVTSGTISLTTDITTSGTLKAGAVTYPNIHGTNGQVLTTTGSGTLSWTSIPTPDLTNYVTTNTAQTITGAKTFSETTTFSKDLAVNGMKVGRGGGNKSTNTASGASALNSNSTGENNTAYGSSTLLLNSTGNGNTAIGVNALFFNTTSDNNTAIGNSALKENTTGSNNTASGTTALFNNTTGTYNAAIGNDAGSYIANGSTGNTTSDYSVYLGSKTKASADDAQNEIVIGYNAIGAGSNTIQLGSSTGSTAITNVKTSGTLTAGTVTYPNLDGTAGQVLTTTGSGTLSWTSIPTPDLTNYVTTNTVQTALALKANLASPTFTGTPAAPTAAAGTSTTQVATTAFVTSAVSTSITEVSDEFTATAAQTTFTISHAKGTNRTIKMYINGIRVSNTAYSDSSTTVTYTSANNGGYTILAGDRIQFDFSY